nr:DNA (cytosine-5-)-methyltransferase [uncultured Holophaga sp.]
MAKGKKTINTSAVSKMQVASFFAGIGGFDLGLERAGMQVAFQCEIDSFCQMVLKKHWPHVPICSDITTLKPSDIPPADLWCAGWPCQDLSHANTERKGLAGHRSGLFFDFANLAREAKPKWILLENVSGLLSAEKGEALETVVDTLEEIGYLGGWFTVNALDAGLPQNRERIFFIGSYRSSRAYHFFDHSRERFGDYATRRAGRSSIGSELSASTGGESPLLVQRRGGFGYTKAKDTCPTIRAQTGGHQGGHSDRPILCGQKLDLGRVREADGISRRLDGRRGRLIGNAVVPIIVEWIGHQVCEIEARYR